MCLLTHPSTHSVAYARTRLFFRRLGTNRHTKRAVIATAPKRKTQGAAGKVFSRSPLENQVKGGGTLRPPPPEMAQTKIVPGHRIFLHHGRDHTTETAPLSTSFRHLHRSGSPSRQHLPKRDTTFSSRNSPRKWSSDLPQTDAPSPKSSHATLRSGHRKTLLLFDSTAFTLLYCATRVVIILLSSYKVRLYLTIRISPL